MPERIQLRRTRGWRMPTGAVKVDRTTVFGNPFDAGEYGQGKAVDLFEAFLYGGGERTYLRRGVPAVYPSDALLLTALGGQSLGCWCAGGTPCHADILLALVEALGEGYDENPDGGS